MRRLFHIQLLALLVSVAFFATYAFASSETNLSSKRGEGAATISGWNITDVQYHLGYDPSKISAVEFNLDSPAFQVTIGFDLDSGRSFNCYNVSGYHWQCAVDGIEVARISNLRVIAIN